MSLGGAHRRYAAKQRAVQQQDAKTVAQAAKQGRSLASDTSLSVSEPRTATGMTYTEGRTRAESGYSHSVSGGRHHGVMVNIADSVGHSIAQAEADNHHPSHISSASASLGRAYTHLGMHHSADLQGNHGAAAAHLKKAGEAINYSMGRIGGRIKGGVENAYGEKHARPDLEATVNHTVNHYANTHDVSLGGTVKEPEKKSIETEADWSATKSKQFKEQSYDASTQRKMPTTKKSDKKQALNTAVESTSEVPVQTNTSSNMPSKLGSGSSPTSQRTFDRIKPEAFQQPNMSRKDHVLQAYKDYTEKGRIHPYQKRALSQSDIAEVRRNGDQALGRTKV